MPLSAMQCAILDALNNVLTRVWCQLQSFTTRISSLNGLTKFADRTFDAFYLLRCLMYIANYQKWKIVWNFCPCEAIPAYLKWTIKGNQKLRFLTNCTKNRTTMELLFCTKLNKSWSNLLVGLFHVFFFLFSF